MARINKVIQILIISDLALLVGMGLATPIFAIFLTQNIQGATVETAGIASGIYWIMNSLVMIPFGKFLDKNKSEKDDLFFVIIGNFLTVLVAIGYIFSKLPWHIYVLQAIYGLGMGMNIPGYTAIFTRHIDKGQEASDWALRGAIVGFGIGIAETIGGIIANNFGFNILFGSAAIIVAASAFLLILIIKEMHDKNGITQAPLEFKMSFKQTQPPKE